MSYNATIAITTAFTCADQVLSVIIAIIFLYCIMSWFVRPDNRLYMIVSRFAHFFIAPFRPLARKIIEMGLRIDVSPFLAIFAANILRNLLNQWLIRILY